VSQQEASEKLRSDLKVVVDKARLCREMLPESPGLAAGDAALAEVIGYLEACRTRLMDLIEAGTMGLLEEDMLELCLKTNDVVNKTLEAEANGIPVSALDDIDAMMNGASGSGTASGSGAPSGASAVQAVAFSMDDEDGGLSVKQKKPKAAPADAGKPKFKIKPLAAPPSASVALAQPAASGEADILGLSASPEAAKPAATAATDFDDFFNQAPAPAAPASAPAQPPAAASSAGAAAMTDDDFESFLSNLTTSPKK
jgi:hypothetical protein